MPVVQRFAAILASLFLAVTLAACVKDKPTVLQGSVVGSADINPDSSGQASPVVVRYYELKSTKAFDSAAFFDIYEDANTTLAGDMLNWAKLSWSLATASRCNLS